MLLNWIVVQDLTSTDKRLPCVFRFVLSIKQLGWVCLEARIRVAIGFTQYFLAWILMFIKLLQNYFGSEGDQFILGYSLFLSWNWLDPGWHALILSNRIKGPPSFLVLWKKGTPDFVYHRNLGACLTFFIVIFRCWTKWHNSFHGLFTLKLVLALELCQKQVLDLIVTYCLATGRTQIMICLERQSWARLVAQACRFESTLDIAGWLVV